LIFSSSCTVYGQAHELPITEETPLQPSTSPYGFTKQMGEQIIQDSCKANSNFKSILLRYFNPIGAHPSAQIGEYPQGVPQNLVPFLTQTVIGKRPLLNVFGSNYDTPDGTCIRDYIHVMDLAQAHIESLNYLLSSKQNSSCEIFNVGTGRGASVLELIQEFERATGEKVPYELSAPRAGDTVAAFADVTKIEKQLGWKAQYSLQEALKSAWDWEQQIHVLS
jgi:UDP-glucose 4-epimerase